MFGWLVLWRWGERVFELRHGDFASGHGGHELRRMRGGAVHGFNKGDDVRKLPRRGLVRLRDERVPVVRGRVLSGQRRRLGVHGVPSGQVRRKHGVANLGKLLCLPGRRLLDGGGERVYELRSGHIPSVWRVVQLFGVFGGKVQHHHRKPIVLKLRKLRRGLLLGQPGKLVQRMLLGDLPGGFRLKLLQQLRRRALREHPGFFGLWKLPQLPRRDVSNERRLRELLQLPRGNLPGRYGRFGVDELCQLRRGLIRGGVRGKLVHELRYRAVSGHTGLDIMRRLPRGDVYVDPERHFVHRVHRRQLPRHPGVVRLRRLRGWDFLSCERRHRLQ